jgi:hypothetical protein
MSESQALLLATSALGFYSAGQVWLVQLSSYRLWLYVGESEFPAYHEAWWRSIWGVILAPAALVTIGATLMFWARPPDVPMIAPWLGAALQGALVLGTALWWGPLMARIKAPSGGLLPARYRLLMTTHWLRVGLVTAYAFLAVWMLAQSAWRS